MRATLLTVSLGVLAGCGDDSSTSPDAAPPTPGTARFDPPTPGAGADWGVIPYPSDLFLDDEGALRVTTLPVGPLADPASVTMLQEGLATLTGAGLRSNVYFPVTLRGDGAIDEGALATSAVLIDLEASTSSTLATIDAEVVWRDDLDAISIVPLRGTVLRPAHTYAAYLTTDVGLAPDPDFAAAADLSTTPADPAIAAAQASLRPLLELLPADTRGRLAAATVFRTNDVATETRKMRDAVAANPPTVTVLDVHAGDAELDAILGDQAAGAIPGVCNNGVRPQPHESVAALIHGTMTLSNLLSDTPNVDGYPELDGDGDVVVKGTTTVRYTLSVPATTADWNAVPVIVYVHGVNRTRQDMVTQIETAGRMGAAVIAIDLPYHGHRAARPADQHDLVNPLLGTSTPDGFGDDFGLSPAIGLFHLVESGGIPGNHPRGMAENLRAAAIEVAQVVAFVRDGDDAPIEAAIADVPGLPDTLAFRDDVALLTESLGGLVGGIALGVEPSLGAAYIVSPAAGFPEPAMLHSPNYAGIFSTAIVGPYDIGARVDLVDPARAYRYDPIVMLFGNVFERGDALAYAGELDADLVVAMPWGDVWVANDSPEGYARAIGLPHATMALPEPPSERLRYVELDEATWPVAGNRAGNKTGVFVVFNPAGHASLRKYADSRNYEPLHPPFVPADQPLFPNQIAQHHELYTELFTGYWSGAVSLTDPFADADPDTGGSACP